MGPELESQKELWEEVIQIMCKKAINPTTLKAILKHIILVSICCYVKYRRLKINQTWLIMTSKF